MRQIEIAIILIFCAAMARCSAIKVTNSKGQNVGGVPFYTKSAVCEHKTVWLEPTYLLTLSLGEGSTLTMQITQQGYLSDEFKKLKESILPDCQGASTVLKNFGALKNAKDDKDPTKYKYIYIPPAISADKEFAFNTSNLILVSNENKPNVFIDYSNPYYLNARKPLSGSVNPNISLNSDLTLGTVSVNIQDDTLKTILSVLPISELLSGIVKRAPAGAAAGQPIRPSPPITLKIDPKFYKLTFSEIDHKSKLPCGEPDGMIYKVGGDNKINFVRSDSPAKESKEQDEGGNKVKFSGEADLPKTCAPSPK